MSDRDKLVGHAFISYVREDSDRVDQLQQKLNDAGIPVWRDTIDLQPGEIWQARVRQAITDDARVFIACFSRSSVGRKTSYQNSELMLAIDELRQRRPGDSWLIPVRFDDCRIPDLDIGGGRTLASIHRSDLFGESSAEAFRRLVATVLRILGEPSEAAASIRTPSISVLAEDRRTDENPGSAKGSHSADSSDRTDGSPSDSRKRLSSFLGSTTALVSAIATLVTAIAILIGAFTGLRAKIDRIFFPGQHQNSSSVRCPSKLPKYYEVPKPLGGLKRGELAICPVNINDGRPIGKTLNLSGLVLGSLPQDDHLMLISRSDPATCDLKGRHGTGGYSLYREISISSNRTPWQVTHVLYAGSETIRRYIYFVYGSTSALKSLQADKVRWEKNNHGRSGYPGVGSLSPGLLKLAYVTVQGSIPYNHYC